MNSFTKAYLLLYMLRWRLTWKKYDLDYRPPGLDPKKFLTARQAISLIPDGAAVMSCGFAGCARCSLFYWGIRDAFDSTGHPRDLTWMAAASNGSRGRVPGSVEELDRPGIIRRFIGGHLETMKAILKIADQGHVELHNLPQAQMTYLLEAQARGEDSVVSDTGIGSFLDPRVGGGSVVLPGRGESLITVDGDFLRFTMPKVQIAMFNIPYADAEGNLYATNAAVLSENRQAAAAARRNGGTVMVSVTDVVPKDQDRIYMKADEVDAIIVHPWNEQVGNVPQRRYWPMFTVGANVDRVESVAKIKYINRLAKITPMRHPPEDAMARVAAGIFCRVAGPGADVNIGVGLPEEVCRVLVEQGLASDLHIGCESGVYGGLPSPGAVFGSAIAPEKMMHSAEIFHRWEKKLDVAVLGLLEADEDGSVNVSHRGPGAINFIGVGGFSDLTNFARTVIFIGSWMAGAEFLISGDKLVIAKPGTPKFIRKVSAITMYGPRALEQGKQLFYVTHVGVFRLTSRGMEIASIMPGVDLKKDIMDVCPMRLVLPESGEVPVIGREFLTGRGFKLRWES